MAENMTSFSGTVAVTAAVNSMPPNTGTYVPAAEHAGTTGGQVKITPSNVVFQNSSGDTPLYASNSYSSFCNNSTSGLTHQQVDPVSGGGVVSVDGANTITGPPPTSGTLPVTTAGVKKTSFQITSVTVDSSASNDGGDDSADDLDESHTKDTSDVATDVSRHTSESRAAGGTHTANDDSFTRNDIFYNPAPPSSMNIAPVIPTSSQYGLAIVPEGLNPASEAPPPAPAIMNDPAGDKTDDKDIVHNRFKVVKIVSTEPFKKGRWMCMDYFDHTTTTSRTTAVKDNAPPQSTQQSILQSQTHSTIQQPLQSNAEKVPSNTVHVQGSNVSMTSSPPQASTILQQDSQQQASIVQQQNQPPQHVMQTQMQSNMHDQDGSMNSSGLPNGNGAHYHSNDNHNVQGVYMNHVAPPSSVMTSNVTDSSAFSSPMPNHNPNIPSAGNTFQSSISQQQQQQQYYNNPGVMTGMPPPRPVSVAPTPSITTQQQQTMAPQQPSMNSQQTSRPLTGQVPIVHSQTQPQTLGQIGPQSSISQNTSVPILTQTMPASQMHQAPVQVTQPSHLPAQSLPHGAHAQMTGSGSISNTPEYGGTSAPQQQQQQHAAAQSLGHNMLQQNKPAFMNQPQQHQQSQVQAQNQFQQQANSQQQQQQLMSSSQQSVMGGQQNSNQQNPGQISQNSSNQQGLQPQNYQAGVMMQNIPGLPQQVHVQQMNTPSQHSVQMQQGQPNAQNQGMYNSTGQMMGHSMNMQQNTQPLMQQQNVIQNQNMMQQQAQIVGQQHPQQMMSMPPQQQAMVSQNQAAPPPQPIMTQPQMMSQMMQNPQISGMVTQTPMVSQQPGVIPQQQQGIMPSQANLPQPNMMQQMPQQPNYTSQTQPQTINNQQSMQQPVMQPYPQPQPNPMAQQQQMLPPQSQSNIMTPQMAQSINQGQQMSIQQQSGQQNQAQSAPQQQQQQPQVNIPSQPQQSVFQNASQQMQVSQGNVPQNMTNLQSVHNMMPPSSQSMPQLSTSTGMQLQSNDSTTNVNAPNSDASTQQPQSIVQQQQPAPVSVSNVSQVQANAPAAPSPEIHHTHTSQSQSITSQMAPVSTIAASNASPAITSLSAAATVIIDGVNSLGDSTAGGNGNEDGESATGTNTVAIDNKIEQAMDLVKSHLMFAVREEVEVLKEKISELMERITQLEYENSILRANASQETLAQLQKSNQHPAPNVNEGHQGFS